MIGKAAGRPLRLFLSGDVMLGRGVDQIMAHPGDPALHEDYVGSACDYVALAERVSGPLPRHVEPSYVWGDLLPELDSRQPHLRLINLETAITTSDRFALKGINYRMHPANAPALSAAAIDACTLANNHVLDWGREGLVETLQVLDAAGIAHAGAGGTEDDAWTPLTLDTKAGRRVILVALGCTSSGIPPHWRADARRAGIALLPDDDDETIIRLRQAARGRRPEDLLVLSVHWGGNWSYDIPNHQRTLAHRLVDEAGVDLVWGHSSHHPKAAEVHHGKLILYGCGDLLNDYEGISGREEFRSDLALAWFAEFQADGAKLKALEMVPYRVSRFRLCRAAPDDASWLAARMDQECRRFGGSIRTTADGSFHLRWPS